MQTVADFRRSIQRGDTYELIEAKTQGDNGAGEWLDMVHHRSYGKVRAGKITGSSPVLNWIDDGGRLCRGPELTPASKWTIDGDTATFLETHQWGAMRLVYQRRETHANDDVC